MNEQPKFNASVNDEREGLPSASSAEILYRCPGSKALRRQAPPAPETEIAAAGTRIHAAKETGDTDDLESHNEEIVFDELDKLENEAMQTWMADLGSFAKAPPAFREFRLWMKDRATAAPLASAKLDVHWLAVEHHAALALDYKSGFKDVTDSDRNIQTRIQALTLWHEYPFLQRIRVGVLQGRLRKISLADYDLNTLRLAEQEFLFHNWMADQPDAPRVPGKHCKYCPAKAICREAMCYALMASVMSAEGDLVSPKEQAWLWKRKGITDDVFDAVTIALKSLPTEELAGLGLGIKPNAPTMELPDAQTVFSTLFERGLIDAATYRDCCKPLKGRIEKVVVPIIRSKEGCTAAVAKSKVNAILEPISTMKEKNPSLVEL